ncbi:hypothetical protein A4H97_19550 [Niastella yeongjuensis]|uniref:Uncharacterized protein n=2 Tax=Niastella yeongjuensis TaxID=354355 RepID=A0A1V9DYI0_9BACT|nr:hypothetical protein A4H97_19550 [Niastella yeongjuensis]
MSCARTTILKDGYSKAPVNPKVFKNRVYFDKSILTQVDTTVIYELYNDNFYVGFEKQPDVLARFNYKDVNTIYGVYRFYGNGCFSLFHLDRKKPELTSQFFDPAYTGWRGVLYKKKNKILGDEFTQVGPNSWQLGKQIQEFIFNGDTLIVDFKNVHKYTYIKRHIEPKLLEHKADW